MSDARLREDICRYGRSLFERGLTPGSSGNISVRLPDGGWLATPTNASLGFLDPARLSRLDAQGRHIAGDAPTKEIPLHTALYDTRGATKAIVHLHSTHSAFFNLPFNGIQCCHTATQVIIATYFLLVVEIL